MDLELIKIILNEENNFNYNSANSQLINKASTPRSNESNNIIIISDFLYIYIIY